MDNNNLPALTADAAMLKITIALTKQSIGIQKLQTASDSIENNEDSIPEMKELLNLIKKAIKIVTDEHQVIKKPYYTVGKACDEGKNSLIASLEAILKPLEDKHTKLCEAQLKRRLEQEEATRKKKEILDGVESNIILFSQKIALCNTRKELQDVERLIHLEKSPSRAAKYGIHHEYAINRYNEKILPVLNDQKDKIEAKKAIEKQLSEAEKNNDVLKIDELKEQKEQIEDEIIENRVKIQEQALNQETPQIIEAEEVFPDLKTARVDISVELVDVAVAFKKCPELLTIELKKLDARKIGFELRDSGGFNGKDEIILNGIKYSLNKKW